MNNKKEDNFFMTDYSKINKDKESVEKTISSVNNLTREFKPKIKNKNNHKQFLITRIEKTYISKFKNLAKKKNLTYGNLFEYLIKYYEGENK